MTRTNNDKDLQRNVMEELEFEPAVNAAEIGVTVKNGVVTLTGSVPTFTEKLAAERAVKRVFGVKGVAEEITISLLKCHRRTDTDITCAAVKTLELDAKVPSDHVKVTVEDGWVRLEGEVQWYQQKLSAQDAVRILSGVKGVANLISVRRKKHPSPMAHG